jgi:integrase
LGKQDVGIRSSHGRLQLIYWLDDKRHFLSLGLPDSPSNRLYAEIQSQRLRADIIQGLVDRSMARYKPPQVTTPPEPEPPKELLILELWDRYVQYKSPQLAQSTICKDFSRISRHLGKIGNVPIGESNIIASWLSKNTTPATTKKVLTQLSTCCAWAVKSKQIDANPFEGMAKDIRISRSSSGSDINPFSHAERAAIINKFWVTENYYASFVEFLFRTGCRPSEAIGLQWRNVSSDFRVVRFTQSVTESNHGLKLKQGLKSQSKREFPCGDGMAQFLQRLKPDPFDGESFVFPSEKNRFISLGNLARRHWHPMLSSLCIERRTIYQCRHTYITHCLDSGLDAKDVARLVGNSAEVIYRYYAGVRRNLVAPDI